MLDLNFGPFGRLNHDGFMLDIRSFIFRVDADFMDLFGDMHVFGQVDLLQNLNVDGNTTSNSFIKQNGLSTEFLKADGSVDNATYLTATGTAANVSGVVAIANGGTAATTAAEALTNLGAAPIDSPTFTGVPLAPTATAGISTTQIATTAFVTNAVSAASGAFVDLTSGQTIAGAKTFSSDIVVNGLTIGKGTGQNGDNTAIGAGALNSSNANGTRNTAVGASALLNYIGTSFDNNTGVGYSNMAGLTTGDGNTSVGAETMLSVATGSNNTGIGNQSLISTSGNNNVGVGTRSGDGLTTGSNNTFLGTQAKTTSAGATVSNATAIGYAAEVGTDNTIQLGNATVTNVNTSGSYTGSGFKTPTGTPTQYLMADGSVSNGSSTTVGAISTSSDPNGATITAGELKLAPADASNGGIITTADQTFAGAKTFSDGLRVENKPFLPTKLTQSQINSLTGVEEGMVVYNTDSRKLQVYSVGSTDVINDLFSGSFTDRDLFDFEQSFVSPTTGVITAIQFFVKHYYGSPYLDFYVDFENSTGSYIGGGGYFNPSNNTSVAQWVNVEVNNAVVTSGQAFKFRVMSMMGRELMFGTNSNYPNGALTAICCGPANGDDVMFKILITPTNGSSAYWVNLN